MYHEYILLTQDIHKLDLQTRHWEKIFVSRGDSSEPQPRYLIEYY